MANVLIGGKVYSGVNKINLQLSDGSGELAKYTNNDTTILDGTFSGVYENNELTKIRGRGFYGVPGITSFIGANVEVIETYCFDGCKNLVSVNTPKLTNVGSAAFSNCSALLEFSLPAEDAIIQIMAFQNCTALKRVDIRGAVNSDVSTLTSNAFNNCAALETLIIRSTFVPMKLNNDNVFTGTPIANGTGYVYVPNAMLATYQADTTWQTYANQLRAIEDYPEICSE